MSASNRESLDLDPKLLSDDRNLLKDQVAYLLRRQILAGRISSGARLVERDVADNLGISRMPARDALMQLENEGLVVARRSGRFVVELNETDIHQLFQVRLSLEELAVELAARNNSPQNCAELGRIVDRMKRAVAENDSAAYIESDLEAHRLIWQQAGNPYLLRMLASITGPIMMFMASQSAEEENWKETLDLHAELVGFICEGSAEFARQSIKKHLELSLQLSLNTLAIRRQARNGGSHVR